MLALVGLASCQDKDGFDGEQQNGSETLDSVYSVRIPATMAFLEQPLKTKGIEFVDEDSTLRFVVDTSETVYLYNETKRAFACSYEAEKDTCLPIVLHPGEISGHDFVIAGDVTFYRYVDSCGWELVRVDDNDCYSLFYGDYYINTKDLDDVYYSSDSQSGTWDDVDEYCYGEGRNFLLSKAGDNLSFDGDRVRIYCLPALILLEVDFTDELGDTISAPQIDGVELDTKNHTHVLYYCPLAEEDEKYVYLYMDMETIVDSGLCFWLLFRYNELHSPLDDCLEIVAYDVDGNQYCGAVNLIDEGMSSGTYYVDRITLEKQDKKVFD